VDEPTEEISPFDVQGQPYAFLEVMLLMGALLAVLVAYFRRRGWL
jgi:hypothetical protein